MVTALWKPGCLYFFFPSLHSKTVSLGWIHGLVGKGVRHQTRWPEFNSQHPQGRRRELTPSRCSLTYIWMLWLVHMPSTVLSNNGEGSQALLLSVGAKRLVCQLGLLEVDLFFTNILEANSLLSLKFRKAPALSPVLPPPNPGLDLSNAFFCIKWCNHMVFCLWFVNRVLHLLISKVGLVDDLCFHLGFHFSSPSMPITGGRVTAALSGGKSHLYVLLNQESFRSRAFIIFGVEEPSELVTGNS